MSSCPPPTTRGPSKLPTSASARRPVRTSSAMSTTWCEIRGYADLQDSIDMVLMLIPNESVYAFMHEAEPRAVSKALRHRVVLCSPLPLFSVLAIVRRAIENFQLEKRSGEILRCLDAFREEWDTFTVDWHSPRRTPGPGRSHPRLQLRQARATRTRSIATRRGYRRPN